MKQLNLFFKLFIFLLLFFPSSLIGQNKKYRKINRNIIEKYLINNAQIDNLKKGKFSKAADITTYLPINHSKKGNVDYTKYLQKGLDNNLAVIMPNFPILIDPNGLRVKSNSQILFQNNSKLIITPNDKESYNGIVIDNVENVQLYYPKIEGDKHKHYGKKGEWGMGILIWHSKNIYIYNPIITKHWGDGIYIGNNNNIISENIVIENGFIDDNRRNGISIIAGKDIVIKNTFISNTSGTAPEAGLDIEPNKNSDVIENIQISNLITYNNNTSGLLIALDNLPGKLPSSPSIKIEDHFDFYSTVGMDVYIDRDYTKHSNKNLTGNIYVKNSKYYFNPKAAFRNNSSKPNRINFSLDGITITNKRRTKHFGNIQDVKKFVSEGRKVTYK